MKKYGTDIYKLDNFEGQLEFLFHLVQKAEIEITDVPVKQLIEQYISKYQGADQDVLDEGAEFISTAASLLWWKSKALLPEQSQPKNEEDPQLTFDWDIVPQLIDYCRFKDMAKELSHMEEEQNFHYFRGKDPVYAVKRNLGVEHLTLEDLAHLFQQVLSKAKPYGGVVLDENWKVSDKIVLVRELLTQNQEIPFESIFSPEHSRVELIVTFLAILELMKLGELVVIKSSSESKNYIICKSYAKRN